MSNTILDTLLQELAQKDFLTYQHSIAVAEKMKAFAEKIGLDLNLIQEAEILGAVHDLSKTKVAPDVFKKLQAGQKASERERKVLQQPPEVLLTLLPKEILSDSLITAIQQMHTRFDGKGNPNTKGESIHILTRMLKIADYYDLLMRHRAGQTPLNEEKTQQVLENNRGILFDPALTQIFIQEIIK